MSWLSGPAFSPPEDLGLPGSRCAAQRCCWLECGGPGVGAPLSLLKQAAPRQTVEPPPGPSPACPPALLPALPARLPCCCSRAPAWQVEALLWALRAEPAQYKPCCSRSSREERSFPVRWVRTRGHGENLSCTYYSLLTLSSPPGPLKPRSSVSFTQSSLVKT